MAYGIFYVSFLSPHIYFLFVYVIHNMFFLLSSQIPAIQRKTVELNGVLVTHALITIRELTIKCAQHYSWYCVTAMLLSSC